MNGDGHIIYEREKMETTPVSNNRISAVVGENVTWKDVQNTLREKSKHTKNLIFVKKKKLFITPSLYPGGDREAKMLLIVLCLVELA